MCGSPACLGCRGCRRAEETGPAEGTDVNAEQAKLGAEGREGRRRSLAPEEGAEGTSRGTVTTLPGEEVANT